MMRHTLDFGSPLPPGWTTLDDQNRYWDQFTDRFRFRPGLTESDWPAMAEPTPSITFDLTAPADIAGAWQSRFDAINAEALRCFVSDFPEDPMFVVLDWQHTCYRHVRTPVGADPVRVRRTSCRFIGPDPRDVAACHTDRRPSTRRPVTQQHTTRAPRDGATTSARTVRSPRHLSRRRHPHRRRIRLTGPIRRRPQSSRRPRAGRTSCGPAPASADASTRSSLDNHRAPHEQRLYPPNRVAANGVVAGSASNMVSECPLG